MAPKRANRGDPNNSVNQSDITNKHSADEQRQWEGQPYRKPLFYVCNKRTLYKDMPEARQFITSGVIVGSKNVTVCPICKRTSVVTT